MAFKDRLSTFLAGPASQVVEAPVREIIQDALAGRSCSFLTSCREREVQVFALVIFFQRSG